MFMEMTCKEDVAPYRQISPEMLPPTTVVELLKALNLAVVPRPRFCKQNKRQLHSNRIV